MSKTMAERFLKVRKILGLTQEKLAKFLGVNRSFLAQVEGGIRYPSVQTLLAIEKKLGISKAWLETGRGLIFTDSEKAMKHLKTKEKYSIEELHYILSQMQNIYSLFDEFLVRKEFAGQIIEILQKFSLCEANVIVEYKKAIENEGVAWGRLMDEMIACIVNHIVERDFDIAKELHDELQKLISDWGMYVFVAAAMYEKHKLVPVESIHIDFDSLKQEKAYYEGQMPRVVAEEKGVKILNFCGHFVLDVSGKGYIEFEKERLFGFICAVLNVKNDEKKRVLDYEIFYTEVEKLANIKQKDITLSLSLNEFYKLKECLKEIKKNQKFWQWLQFLYIEKHGFV